MDLFEKEALKNKSPFAPLADRVRPKTLNDFGGQKHLVGEGRLLRTMIENKEPVSMIFWGPPGVGKTTLARIIASETGISFFSISAVTAGLADVRKIIEKARINRKGLGNRTILFIDEIHRFNKAQQDALLHSVEDGTILFIGATTENPSFEVIGPLLSRCRVLRLEPLDDDEIRKILHRALTEDPVLKSLPVQFPEKEREVLIHFAAGDARAALSGLELCIQLAPEKNGKRNISIEIVREALQKQSLRYDKKGDAHYDTISAFIKSMRGSDPDAAVYWLARMLDGGEDPKFIARRMIILASEDVGNAEPDALVVANAVFQAVHTVGMPEARIILAQGATYLASCPKSNASYVAVSEALEDVKKFPGESVPLHLRNAPTPLMKEMGYSEGYKYAHDYEGGFVLQEFLPPRLKNKMYYRPKEIGKEKGIRERLHRLRPGRKE
jgi:putative ATPase